MAPINELELGDRPQATDPGEGDGSELLRRLVGPFLPVDPPEPRTPTGFYTDTTICIGCKACEVACKQWNQLPADGLNFTAHSYDNTQELSASSWRHVKFIEQFPADGPPRRPVSTDVDASGDDPVRTTGRWLMMSDVCKHCVAAPCQHACPTGAIVYNEFSNVYIQPDICNGCAYCVAACPFGVITRSALDGHAHKCTLCYDRQKDGLVPACAKSCPTGSIQFGPIEELREKARRRVRDLHARGVAEAHLYGHEETGTYTALNSFYLLVDRASTYGLPDDPFNPWLNMRGDYARAALGGVVSLAAAALAMWLLPG
jgi:formate dehydrogenase iron-sulfur subunit